MPEEPFFRYHVFSCQNLRDPDHVRGSCAAKGSETLRDYMKDRCKALGIEGTRINAAGCLDRCELGPVMVVYPQGVWYHVETKDDVDAIIDTHLLGGEPVERLMLHRRQKQLEPRQV